MAHFCIKRLVKSKKSSLSRGRISPIKAASTAILTLNGSNINADGSKISRKKRNVKGKKKYSENDPRNPGNSGLWGMFPVRISIQMGGRTVIVDLISFRNLLHCAIPFFLRISSSGIISCSSSVETSGRQQRREI